MFPFLKHKPKYLDPASQEKLQKKNTLFMWGAIFFSASILSVQVVLWLFSSIAHYGSHSALILFDLSLIFSIPLVLLGWPLLQCFTIYLAFKFFGWGFHNGFKTFCIMNLVLFVTGGISTLLTITEWPKSITDAASDLNEIKILNSYTRTKSTLAQSHYAITPKDEAIAIPLPQGLLAITISGFEPGAIRYGIIPKESTENAMMASPAHILPCQKPLFKKSEAQESLSSIFSVVLFGTAKHTLYQSSSAYPRELILIREPSSRSNDKDISVRMEIQELTPSIFGILLYWTVSIMALCFFVFMSPKIFRKRKTIESKS